MIDLSLYEKHLDRVLDFDYPVCLICLTNISENEVAIRLPESVLGEGYSVYFHLDCFNQVERQAKHFRAFRKHFRSISGTSNVFRIPYRPEWRGMDTWQRIQRNKFPLSVYEEVLLNADT